MLAILSGGTLCVILVVIGAITRLCHRAGGRAPLWAILGASDWRSPSRPSEGKAVAEGNAALSSRASRASWDGFATLASEGKAEGKAALPSTSRGLPTKPHPKSAHPHECPRPLKLRQLHVMPAGMVTCTETTPASTATTAVVTAPSTTELLSSLEVDAEAVLQAMEEARAPRQEETSRHLRTTRI